MTAFPTYDPHTDTLQLNGGAVILLTLLMKAKFGERFDPLLLFHPRLAELVHELARAAETKFNPGDGFERSDLFLIAETVFGDSFQNDWWTKSTEHKVQFLQDAAAPWILSSEQIELILEDVDVRLWRARRITDLAGPGGMDGQP